MPRDAKPTTGTPILLDLYRPTGTSGLRRTGQWIEEGSARELFGPDGRKRLREMADMSPVIAASLKLIELAIRNATFEPKPMDPDEAQWPIQVLEERAAFVKSCLRDMSVTVDDVHSEMLSAHVQGWALLEEVIKLRAGEQPEALTLPATPGGQPRTVERPSSKYDDGLIGWEGFHLRGQETLDRWEFDADGVATGMWQNDMWSQPSRGLVQIPLSRALHYRTESTKGNPEGRSLLTPCWRTWVIVKRVQEWEALGIQRELNGVPVMRVPSEVCFAAAGGEGSERLQLVKRMIYALNQEAGAGIILPSELAEGSGSTSTERMWDVELMSNNGTRSIDAGAVIKRLEHRMASALLTAFMLLGQDQVGSYALAENNADMFLLALNSVASSIADVWTRQAFPRLMRYNGWPASQAPVMTVQRIKRLPTPKDLASILAALSGAGAAIPTVDESGWQGLLDELGLRPSEQQL